MLILRCCVLRRPNAHPKLLWPEFRLPQLCWSMVAFALITMLIYSRCMASTLVSLLLQWQCGRLCWNCLFIYFFFSNVLHREKVSLCLPVFNLLGSMSFQRCGVIAHSPEELMVIFPISHWEQSMTSHRVGCRKVKPHMKQLGTRIEGLKKSSVRVTEAQILSGP